MQANFNATPIAGLPGLNVKFSTVFIGNAGHFIYDFGDGNVQDYFGDFRNIPAPSHLYQEPGEYDVTLMAHGSGGRDTLTIPNLVYIDPTYDYLDLTLVQGGTAWPGEGWDNAIDHDTYGANSILAALPSDASGVFIFADSLAHDIYKLRLLTDTVEPDEFQTQYLKEFELFVSDDGLTYTSAFKGTCVKQDGGWDLFVLPAPVRAKYLKLTLLSARHPQAYYIELAEFQVFGTTAAPLAKADLKLDVPTQFNLTNYPNPFNPETTIRFELPEAAQVNVAIYNMQGQLIRNLVNAYQNMGYHNLTWDARDDQGATVAGGVYVAKLLVTGETQKLALIRKLVFMK
ncbi:T9SS type A sorting domain-containing protein [candidate division KSB1 bacterium]|nr:T9SS type A sorting domain-containing protein [candidate division KSB1 bacterium]